MNLPNNQIIGVGTVGESDQRAIIFHYDDFRKVYSDDNYDYYDLIGATRNFPLNPIARLFTTTFSHTYTLTDTKVSGHSIEGGTLSLLAFTDEARDELLNRGFTEKQIEAIKMHFMEMIPDDDLGESPNVRVAATDSQWIRFIL